MRWLDKAEPWLDALLAISGANLLCMAISQFASFLWHMSKCTVNLPNHLEHPMRYELRFQESLRPLYKFSFHSTVEIKRRRSWILFSFVWLSLDFFLSLLTSYRSLLDKSQFKMGQDNHHHEGKKPLAFFASPLKDEPGHSLNVQDDSDPDSRHSTNPNIYKQGNTSINATEVSLSNSNCSLPDESIFHHHAEAPTSELFYDLFFVANLTTFTALNEINDANTLKAYVGFFSLLWLTWYQVSLYDVRFSTDSVFERVAKALHFGVMVGFAVIGPEWKPGTEIDDYSIYKAFGLILMVSRLTLFTQYGVTLFYTRRHRDTIVPLCIIMVSTLLSAILYGALIAAFPKISTDAEGYSIPAASNIYIAWYIIAIFETVTRVTASIFFKVISFKDTHIVQRMSLLTLIILGEGIIVICKAISKIVKNEFLWTSAVVGQIAAAVLIIYFLYMLYFDWMGEKHFNSIKQQLWSFLHFPLHIVFVLVLQGVSLLIMWCQLVQVLFGMSDAFGTAYDEIGNAMNGSDFASHMESIAKGWVFDYVPKGVDASAQRYAAYEALNQITEGFDWISENADNATAIQQLTDGVNELVSAATTTLFDSFGVSVPKKKVKYDAVDAGEKQEKDFMKVLYEYLGVFQLVFSYVFVAVSNTRNYGTIQRLTDSTRAACR